MADVLSTILSRVSGLGGAGTARERSMALEAVLRHAAEVGIEEALARFGKPLSETDKKTLRSLTPAELETLAEIRCKLSALRSTEDNNNNNIF